MTKLRGIISKLYMRTVVGTFGAIIAVLTVTSIFFSSSLRESEKTIFSYDQPLLHVAVLLGILFLGRYFAKIRPRKESVDKAMLLAVASFLGICIFIVFSLWIKPVADQRSVLLVAKQMKEQDFSAFQKGGYVFIYPNQIGIILAYYLLSFVIGDYNYIALQLINIAALALSYYYLAKLSVLLFEKKGLFYKTLIGCMLFLPLACYICFVYGNLIGLALSVGAVYYECLYLKDREKKQILVASIMVAVAVLLKSNYLITFVAMVIVLLMDAMEKKKWQSYYCIIAMFACYLGLQFGVATCMEGITGEQISDGVPKLAWVAMGLQEGSRASGWYNGFNKRVYVENEYDTHEASKESKEAIHHSLKRLNKDKRGAVGFFARKVASQWNNPTFQSLWILREKAGEDNHGWYKVLLTGFMNLYQTVILSGTCLYLWYYRGKRRKEELILMVIFIGGFLFHLVWEAKAQYTITYFVLLIPYAVRGFDTALLRKIID